MLGYYQSLADLGEGKYPIPAYSVLSALSTIREEYNTETLVKFTVRRHRLTKDRYLVINYKMLSLPPPPHFTTILLKAYLQKFLLPGISCPAIKKKLQAYQKAKKKKC